MFFCSCDTSSEGSTDEITAQINNDTTSTQSTAIAIYNQAYQENFEADAIADILPLCAYVHEKGMKCMAKNMTEDASDFHGVLYESYTLEKNWRDQSGAQSFLDAGKLAIINHYNETACSQVYSEYKGIYNTNLSFICEGANLKKDARFNE